MRKFTAPALALLFALSARADITTGLVASYPFNGSAQDASGNGHDGTVSGAILTTDRFGNANGAHAFNGTNSRISFDFATSSDNTFTWSWWISGSEHDEHDSPVAHVDNGCIWWLDRLCHGGDRRQGLRLRWQ